MRKFTSVIWFLLIFILLTGLLFWLPIQLELDTRQQRYELRWAGILRFRAIPEEKRLRWYFRLFFWEKELIPGKNKTGRQDKPKKKKKPGKKPSASFSVSKVRALFRSVLRAFYIKRLWINWDTGDFVYNAWLYPAFRMASQGRRQLVINFMGDQEVAILLQTRLGLMAAAAMRALFILKR